MSKDDVLFAGLPALLKAATARLPIDGLGVLRSIDAEALVMTYAGAFGVGSIGGRLTELPESIRSGAPGISRLTQVDLARDPEGLVEHRLLLTGFPDDIRQAYGVRQLFVFPVPEIQPLAIVLVGSRQADSLSADQMAGIDSLARRSAALLTQTESPQAELERLRRLAALDALLPTLFRVLDIREIFDRLSEIVTGVLPHDFMALGIFSNDRPEFEVYAQTSASRLPQTVPNPYPRALLKHWMCNLVDDLTTHPVERGDPLTLAGMRSSLRVAVRLDNMTIGGLNFGARETSRFTPADVAIGLRIADYVALALSHHQRAEEARQGEVLRTRAAKIDLLDELLASVTDAGQLPDVFDRISSVSQKVLAHDALILTAVLPNGTQARVYASKTAEGAAFPDLMSVPPALRGNDHWESEVVDDLRAEPDHPNLEAAQRGYRSLLRVPIRLDGKDATGISFLSVTPSFYTRADVPAARRIADRIALSFSRERGNALAKRADEATTRAARLESRVRALTEELDARTGCRRVIGESPSWRQVLTQATQVASTDTTVLLLGESGTGKEVVARFLHRASPRSDGPFVALNCAALPEHLLEAELFGFERGAFTGAAQSKPGQLEQAAGGLLFLDEVGEMTLPAQAKFLRVLQEREFQRLGGNRVLKADVRVVAATNRDLRKAIERGAFREDLYYRLNVFALKLPPLRDRRDDILPLSEAFIHEIGRNIGRPPSGISRDARQALVNYDWPGNVRELRNMLERAAILADGGLIASEHLSLTASHRVIPSDVAVVAAATVRTGASDLQSAERTIIEKALQDARFNKSRAAKALGLSRAQLYVRLKRHGLE